MGRPDASVYPDLARDLLVLTWLTIYGLLHVYVCWKILLACSRRGVVAAAVRRLKPLRQARLKPNTVHFAVVARGSRPCFMGKMPMPQAKRGLK